MGRNRVKRIVSLVLSLVILVVVTTWGLAATATDTATANVYINAGASLTVTETAVAWGSAASPLEAFTSGVLAPTDPSYGYLNVWARCNVRTGYMIAVSATDLVDGTESISARKLGFDIVDNGQPMGTIEYLPAPNTNLNLFPANQPRTTSKDYDLYVRLNLDGTESAGSYSGTVTITLTY